MQLIDGRFRTNVSRYALQCLLATGGVAVILLLLDVVSNVVVVASLGSSAFIAFTMPHRENATARLLVGGYVVGLACGVLCSLAVGWLPLERLPHLAAHEPELLGAVATGLAIFVMVVTNTEHPPAAGAALGIVIRPWDWRTVVVTMVGIVALMLVKRLLKPVLIDLL